MASDPDGFLFPPIPGVDEDPQEEELIVNIPDIYQRVVLRHHDYVQEVDELEEEDPDDCDLDLTAPPLES